MRELHLLRPKGGKRPLLCAVHPPTNSNRRDPGRINAERAATGDLGQPKFDVALHVQRPAGTCVTPTADAAATPGTPGGNHLYIPQIVIAVRVH